LPRKEIALNLWVIGFDDDCKALLAGTPYPFSLTTPTIVNEAGQTIPQAAGTTCLVAVFGSEVGDMVVQVCLRL
jgi:hypothetical protein